MTETEALSKMISPGMKRPGKPLGGVIQIWVTRACDKSCFNCTQGSNLGGKLEFMSLEHFEQACISLKDYFGVVGMFGGNPALHGDFPELCRILREHIPYERRGLWCNNPINARNVVAMRVTFNPAVSNLNVHLDQKAYDMFRQGWPESRPFGLNDDSRHSPPYVAMKDVLWKKCPDCEGHRTVARDSGGSMPWGEFVDVDVPCETCGRTGRVYDESLAWELISNCDINKHWSAMIGVFRGELRAWFCEIAGAQAMLHQHEPDYPDTGMKVEPEACKLLGIPQWWQLHMDIFKHQIRKHCHSCGIPLRGRGELAQATEGREQVSQTHLGVYKPKRVGRKVELVVLREQLGEPLGRMTEYLQNAKK